MLFLLIIIVLFPFAATNSSAAELHYQGTHILTYDTMNRLAQAFTAESGISLTVRGGGCADGVAMVVSNRLEMGGLCCPLKEEEIKNDQLVPHPVARDIKTIIVNPTNPINSVSRAQLIAIHNGRINNWKELGWINKPIAVIYRIHCLDRREPVRTYLCLDRRLEKLTEKAIRVRTDKELIDRVSQFPTAIGITSHVFVQGRPVKSLALNAILPSVANVMAGKYPFTATLFIVTDKTPTLETRRFLDFAISGRGQMIIMKNLAGLP